jgi:hypothetical protein
MTLFKLGKAGQIDDVARGNRGQDDVDDTVYCSGCCLLVDADMTGNSTSSRFFIGGFFLCHPAEAGVA